MSLPLPTPPCARGSARCAPHPNRQRDADRPPPRSASPSRRNDLAASTVVASGAPPPTQRPQTPPITVRTRHRTRHTTGGEGTRAARAPHPRAAAGPATNSKSTKQQSAITRIISTCATRAVEKLIGDGRERPRRHTPSASVFSSRSIHADESRASSRGSVSKLLHGHTTSNRALRLRMSLNVRIVDGIDRAHILQGIAGVAVWPLSR
jgi:hypothetical protein